MNENGLREGRASLASLDSPMLLVLSYLPDLVELLIVKNSIAPNTVESLEAFLQRICQIKQEDSIYFQVEVISISIDLYIPASVSDLNRSKYVTRKPQMTKAAVANKKTVSILTLEKYFKQWRQLWY